MRREGVRVAPVADFSLQTLAAQAFTGLVLGGILVLLATGLSLIFGLMAVVNFSHGSLYMLGAYFGFFLLGFTRNFWIAIDGATSSWSGSSCVPSTVGARTIRCS